MKPTLTTPEMNALRRCSGGLRMWEAGDPRAALVDRLARLRDLGLVVFDEARGYETTPAGETWLAQFDG